MSSLEETLRAAADEVATWPQAMRDRYTRWAESLREEDPFPCRTPDRCDDHQTCAGGCVAAAQEHAKKKPG